MTPPAPAMTSSNGRPDRLGLSAAEAFLTIMLVALLPLRGAALWVNINEFERWAFTEPLFAVVVLTIAGVMLKKGSTPVIPFYLIIAAALLAITGSGYSLWNELHYTPGNEDYLSGILTLSGFFFVEVLAAVGIMGSLLDRRRL